MSMMSWVVAPQWRCRAASGEACADLLEQRQDRIADDEGALAEALEVDPARDGRGVDRGCGLRGDDPGVCLGVGKRPLDLEPRRRRSTPPRRAA